MAATKAGKTGIRGAHVLWMLIGFFALIIGVDAAFITLAIRSHPGEQVKNSYVLGLEYNKELERQNEQRQLGWMMQAGLADEGATFLVELRDAGGTPLSGMDVAVRMHVAGSGYESKPVWLAERAPGEYAMASQLEGPARVEAVIAVSRDREEPAIFEARKTLVLS